MEGHAGLVLELVIDLVVTLLRDMVDYTLDLKHIKDVSNFWNTLRYILFLDTLRESL